jgi:hypothetical protein
VSSVRSGVTNGTYLNITADSDPRRVLSRLFETSERDDDVEESSTQSASAVQVSAAASIPEVSTVPSKKEDQYTISLGIDRREMEGERHADRELSTFCSTPAFSWAEDVEAYVQSTQQQV